jgi:hypothetical protein
MPTLMVMVNGRQSFRHVRRSRVRLTQSEILTPTGRRTTVGGWHVNVLSQLLASHGQPFSRSLWSTER